MLAEEESSDLLFELDKALDSNHRVECNSLPSDVATIDVKLQDSDIGNADETDQMTRFYVSFSEKCHEIERYYLPLCIIYIIIRNS